MFFIQQQKKTSLFDALTSKEMLLARHALLLARTALLGPAQTADVIARVRRLVSANERCSNSAGFLGHLAELQTCRALQHFLK